MKKIYQIIIGVMAVILVVCGIIYVKSLGPKTDKSAATLAFSSLAIQAIVKDWNPEELKQRSHALMIEAIAKSGMTLDEYFSILSKLGKAKTAPDCSLTYPIAVNPGPDVFTVASYTCRVEFENAPAVIIIESRQDGNGPWQIVAFKIDSPLFASLAQQQAPSGEKK